MNISFLLGKCFWTAKAELDYFDHSEHGFDFVPQSKSAVLEENPGSAKLNVFGDVCSNPR